MPLFWLTAFKNVSLIAEMIQPCDEPILASLIDVKSILLESDPMVSIAWNVCSHSEFYIYSQFSEQLFPFWHIDARRKLNSANIYFWPTNIEGKRKFPFAISELREILL